MTVFIVDLAQGVGFHEQLSRFGWPVEAPVREFFQWVEVGLSVHCGLHHPLGRRSCIV